MSALEAKKSSAVNGIDVDALREVVEEVEKDPSKGIVEFKVKTDWKGQTRSETSVESYKLAGDEIKRRFTIKTDEPLELLGENTAANPQELLMAALNACITVGYVAGAAVNGITLSKLSIETSGSSICAAFSVSMPTSNRAMNRCATSYELRETEHRNSSARFTRM